MIGFDDLSDMQDAARSEAEAKPFWAVDRKDLPGLLAWLNTNFEAVLKGNQPRFMRIKENIAYYKGMAYERGSRSDRDRLFSDASSQTTTLRKLKMSVNSLHDMVEQNVARETRYRPAVTFSPGGETDHQDMMASKVVEKITEGVWYREDIDSIIQTGSRMAKIAGEAYHLIRWNPNKGPLHPDYLAKLLKGVTTSIDIKKLSEKKIDDLLEEKGIKPGSMTVKTDSGTVKVEKPVRIGEEEIAVIMPLYILLQPKSDYNDCEWAFYFEYVHIEDLKADFPEKAGSIKASKELTSFSLETFRDQRLHNHCLKIHFYHRTSDKLDRGAYICFTPDVILKDDVNIYAKLRATNGFPWVRRVDDLPPNHLHGIAVMEQAKPLQEKINWLYSSLVRACMIASYPKWVAPRNSVKAENLGNGPTILWYTGAVPPRLEQPNPGAANNFKLIEIFTNEMQKIMGVFGVSRGEPPAGVKSGVAIQFLNEQENERANAHISNLNTSIRSLARLTAFTAGSFYDRDDNRVERLLGSNDAKLAKNFDLANLLRDWDVKAQVSSALPQQKGQRIQTIIDLRREFPGRVDDDEVLEMIGFGQADKFITTNSVNIRAAEQENDYCMQSMPIPDPQKWEDHIAHYRIHIRKLSEAEFKDGTIPKKDVEALKDHIATTEMLMLDIMATNPIYAQSIMQSFPAFPLFMEKPLAPPMPMPMPGEPMPQAMPGMQTPPELMPQRQGLANPPSNIPAGVENLMPSGR